MIRPTDEHVEKMRELLIDLAREQTTAPSEINSKEYSADARELRTLLEALNSCDDDAERMAKLLDMMIEAVRDDREKRDEEVIEFGRNEALHEVSTRCATLMREVQGGYV
jgi:hypothetical protein